jgi:hypothetical protein
VRAAFIAAVIALCVAGLASASGNQPVLKLLSSRPVTVRGQHFQAGERVRLVLLGEQQDMVRVRATTAGSFQGVFAGTAEKRCTGFAVRAVGSLGSRALVRFNPECAPA